MNVLITYSSGFGTTKEVSDKIADVLDNNGGLKVTVQRIDDVNSINEYLLVMMISFLGLLFPPMLHLSGLYENVIFYLWPTQASFILFTGVFNDKGLESWEIAYGFIYQLIWIGVLFILAKKAFFKHIVMKGG